MYGMLLNCTPKNGENGKFYIYFITIEKKKESLGQKAGFDVEYGKKKEGMKKCIAVQFTTSYFHSVPRLWLWKPRVLKKKNQHEVT